MKKTLTALSILSAVLLQGCRSSLPQLGKDSPKKVVAAMTLEEKANFVVGTERTMIAPPEPAPGMPKRITNYSSSLAVTVDGASYRVPGAGGQHYSLSRLGIKPVVYADGPAGLRIDPIRKDDNKTYYCTAFPIGISLAASWDTENVRAVATAIGNEAKEYGVDILLAPAMNIQRSPLCGRNFEYYGEDPVLAGNIAAAYINGVQSNGVGVSLKHFAVNNQETFRNGIDVQLNQETLREIYLKGFEIAVKEGRPWTVMSSYNKVNGTLASENHFLLSDILRGEWGFDGFVMTDWWAEENGGRQIASGNDLLMPGTQRQVDEIIAAVKSGSLDEALLDKAALHIMNVLLRTPTYNGYAYSDVPDLQEHAAVSASAAAEGMVLLKNDDCTLPLKSGKVALFGNASYDILVGGTGSGNVNRKYKVPLDEGLRNAGFEIDLELAHQYKEFITREKAAAGQENFWWIPPIPEMSLTQESVRQAIRNTDVAVLTVGRVAGEGEDRKVEPGDYLLSSTEQENLRLLASEVHAAGKKLVLVLNMGGIVDLTDYTELPDAILHAWMGGQESGNALAAVLSGKNNPSGKLPFTWARCYEDYPSSRNFPLSDSDSAKVCYKEGVNVGYRYFENSDSAPLYPFGFGLSYTSFEYSAPSVKKTRDGLLASVTVFNSGVYPGREVVQLYVSGPGSSMGELKAFAKTRELAPGESQTLELTLSDYSLSSFESSDACWKTARGVYTLFFSASSADPRCTVKYEFGKEKVWPVSEPLMLSADNIPQIVEAMTVEEKARVLVGNGMGKAEPGFSITGSDALLLHGAAGITVGIPRLGIPGTALCDGPAGVRINPFRPGEDRTFYCTGFPVGVSLAGTWNTALVEEVGDAIGEEALEYGADCLLAPAVNLHRNPLNGRNFEYYSEDPLLSGKTAAAYIRGVQGKGISTSLKHFAVNNQETMRDYNDARVGQRALRELYLKNFEIAVKEGHPWTMMTTVNAINGQSAKESHDLLTTILREEWGFDGLVMTDWQPLTDTPAEIHAGNDLMEPGFASQYQDIVDGVSSGALSMEDLDKSVTRLLEYVVKTPRFKEYRPSGTPDLASHQTICRTAAAEGMVLLKNDGQALPFSGAESVALFGVSSYDLIAGGTGSGDVNKAYIISLDAGLKAAGFKPDSSLSALYAKYLEDCRKNEKGKSSVQILGQQIFAEMAIPEEQILGSAERDDIAVVTIGRISGENFDRHLEGDFLLTETERKLVEGVCQSFHAKGKKVVVVLNVGGAIEVSSWNEMPDAILCAWLPGQEGGHSIADVLTGKSYPSGKLPMTWAVDYFDHPSSANFPYDYVRPADMAIWVPRTWEPVRNQDYTIYEEGIQVGYRYFQSVGKKVAYPFGYGLGYTTFSYTNPTVTKHADGFFARVTVTNTGNARGKEIVQLYVHAPGMSGMEKPESELKAFAKTRELAPGESQTLEFSVSDYDLASFNENLSCWEAEAGDYEVRFCASVEDIRCQAGYTIRKGRSWPVARVLN